MALAVSEINFPLKIPNISKFDKIQSSEIIIHGIPWQVEILKPIHDRYWLVYSLRCTNKDNLSPWSYAAKISVKFLSFDPLKEAQEYRFNPHIFSKLEPADYDYISRWDDFFDTKKYFITKLISSKLNVKFKDTICTGNIGDSMFHRLLASCGDLFDPKNGFVNDNSVVLEVKTQMEKLEELPSIAKKRRAADPLEIVAKTIRLECPICLESIKDQDLSSTECGHLFCTECIKGAIRSHKRCPSCNSSHNLKKLRRIYMPM